MCHRFIDFSSQEGLCAHSDLLHQVQQDFPCSSSIICLLYSTPPRKASSPNLSMKEQFFKWLLSLNGQTYFIFNLFSFNFHPLNFVTHISGTSNFKSHVPRHLPRSALLLCSSHVIPVPSEELWDAMALTFWMTGFSLFSGNFIVLWLATKWLWPYFQEHLASSQQWVAFPKLSAHPLSWLRPFLVLQGDTALPTKSPNTFPSQGFLDYLVDDCYNSTRTSLPKIHLDSIPKNSLA